jgi:hypothetical protein
VAEIDQKAVARLLKPRSVAIVGASEEPNTIGGRVLNNLVRAKFSGPLHLVSRTRTNCSDGPACARSICRKTSTRSSNGAGGSRARRWPPARGNVNGVIISGFARNDAEAAQKS